MREVGRRLSAERGQNERKHQVASAFNIFLPIRTNVQVIKSKKKTFEASNKRLEGLALLPQVLRVRTGERGSGACTQSSAAASQHFSIFINLFYLNSSSETYHCST